MTAPDLLSFALHLVTYATVTGFLPVAVLAWIAWRDLRR